MAVVFVPTVAEFPDLAAQTRRSNVLRAELTETVPFPAGGRPLFVIFESNPCFGKSILDFFGHWLHFVVLSRSLSSSGRLHPLRICRWLLL